MWAYDCLSDVQHQLLNKGILDFTGEADGKMIDYAREAIMRLKAMGSPDIEVHITSRGGNGLIGLYINDLFADYDGTITGKVMCYAKSTAVLILQACDIRLASPHSTILIHDPLTLDGVSRATLYDEAKLQALRDELTLERNRILSLLNLRTGRTINDLAILMDEGKDLTPSKAMRWCLIDGVIQPKKGAHD